MFARPKVTLALLVLLAFASASPLTAQTWRSALYPENWLPPETASFTTDKLLQDFSYAGYRRGEAPIPEVTGPVFDVTQAPYLADPTGTSDSTAGYDAHASWVIRMQHCYDSWITGVESYQAAGNSSTCHLLSNGIYLLETFRVTVADCAMRRSQYGGAAATATCTACTAVTII